MTDRLSRDERIACNIVGVHAEAQDVARAVEDFLNSMLVRNYSVRTVNLRQAHLAELARWLSDRGIHRIDDVSAESLVDFQQWLYACRAADGSSRSMGNQFQRLTAVRNLFRWLHRTGRLPANPAEGVELPKLERRLPRAVLSLAEVERVLAQPDLSTPEGLRDRVMLEVLFATGIRRAELAALQASDVDFGRTTLAVRQGKGKKDRMVPISHRALGWIEQYQREARPRLLRLRDPGYLFLTRTGSGCGLKWLSEHVRNYVEAAGMGKVGSCHLFRATTATMMLEGGADIRYIQEMLGHADITTTQVYTRVSVSELQKVYARSHPSAACRSGKQG